MFPQPNRSSGNYAQRVRAILAERQKAQGMKPMSGSMSGLVPKPASLKPTSPSGDNTTMPVAGGRKAPFTAGEYVLPKPYVDAVGGPDVLDQHVQQTLGTLQPPNGSIKTGYAGGGRYQMYNTSREWNPYPAPQVQASQHYEGSPTDPTGIPPEPGTLPAGPPNGNPSTTASGGDPAGRGEIANDTGVDPRTAQWLTGATYQGNPWLGSGQPIQLGNVPPYWTPGFNQGPTDIPSAFDEQGYPFAGAGHGRRQQRTAKKFLRTPSH